MNNYKNGFNRDFSVYTERIDFECWEYHQVGQKIYDYVFVTHLPAFYKTNLYNKLSAQKLSILVIFVSASSVIRTLDFVQSTNYDFDYIILNQLPFEKRNQFQSSFQLIKILKKIHFKKIILGGWDLIEFWIAWILINKSKLAIALESSIHESQTTGPKSWLKKIFASKLSSAYVSGVFQQKLIEALNFNQAIITTGGVGLIQPPKKPDPKVEKTRQFRGRFLYLGRLSTEKNIELLVNLFTQEYKHYRLSLIGKGPLETWIREKTKHVENIELLDHVPNAEIDRVFYTHDVLILPSQREPWGLVVEEALAYGVPVIVSDQVGCHPEIIAHQINGYVFNLKEGFQGLAKACDWVAKNYIALIENIARHPEAGWRNREQKQVAAYL